MRKNTIYIMVVCILVSCISSIIIMSKQNAFTFYFNEEGGIGDLSLFQNINIEFSVSNEINHTWNVYTKDNVFHVQYEPYQSSENRDIVDLFAEFEWDQEFDSDPDVEKVCSYAISGKEQCTFNIQVQETNVLLKYVDYTKKDRDYPIVDQAVIKGKSEHDNIDITINVEDEVPRTYTVNLGYMNNTKETLLVHQDENLSPNIELNKSGISYTYVDINAIANFSEGFELVNDFSGIYRLQNGFAEKIVPFDASYERISSLGIVNNQLIASVVHNYEDAYLELYDFEGNIVSNLALDLGKHKM